MNFLWVILEIQSKLTYLIIVSSHYAFDSIIYSNFEYVFFFFSQRIIRVKILQSPLRCHHDLFFFFFFSFGFIYLFYFVIIIFIGQQTNPMWTHM